jgi:hypothetical protein
MGLSERRKRRVRREGGEPKGGGWADKEARRGRFIERDTREMRERDERESKHCHGVGLETRERREREIERRERERDVCVWERDEGERETRKRRERRERERPKMRENWRERERERERERARADRLGVGGALVGAQAGEGGDGEEDHLLVPTQTSRVWLRISSPNDIREYIYIYIYYRQVHRRPVHHRVHRVRRSWVLYDKLTHTHTHTHTHTQYIYIYIYIYITTLFSSLFCPPLPLSLPAARVLKWFQTKQ